MTLASPRRSRVRTSSSASLDASPADPPRAADDALPGAPAGVRPRAAGEEALQPTARLPGLDGVRALAVAAVLCYHAGIGIGAAVGGYLGVEIFFVLSGFLITGLLIGERRSAGGISLRRFWLRRARRLLPALYVMLAATVLVWRVALPGQLANDRGDAAAGLGYITNWWLILRHQSYFQSMGRPSPFTHLWSLAIEEQFYLIWPLLLVALAWLGRRRLAALAAGGAVVSLIVMAASYHPGQDPSRVYYASDTRASGLLLGAAAALLCWPALTRRAAGLASLPSPGALRGRRDGISVTVQLAGWLALAVIVGCLVRLGEESSLLYRGGFGLVDAAVVVLIVALLAQPTGWLTRLFDLAPLRWLGLRSYGIYLWHWPVFTVTRPGLDLPMGLLPAFLLRIAVTIGLAELSYRFVELPVRGGALRRGWQAVRSAASSSRMRWLAPVAAVLTAIAGFSATAVVVAEAAPARPPAYLAHLTNVDTAAVQPQPAPGARPSPAKPKATRAGHPAHHHKATRVLSSIARCPVSAFGDSVLLGALPALRADLPTLRTVDARVGLQIRDAIATIAKRARADQLGCIVIVHLGNNGLYTAQQFKTIMQLVGPHRMALVVNDHVPQPWQGPNNAFLKAAVRAWPNALLVDWFGYSNRQHAIFYPDETHLDPRGQQMYGVLLSLAYHRALQLYHPGTPAMADGGPAPSGRV